MPPDSFANLLKLYADLNLHESVLFDFLSEQIQASPERVVPHLTSQAFSNCYTAFLSLPQERRAEFRTVLSDFEIITSQNAQIFTLREVSEIYCALVFANLDVQDLDSIVLHKLEQYGRDRQTEKMPKVALNLFEAFMRLDSGDHERFGVL